jgi:hypothetical protein
MNRRLGLIVAIAVVISCGSVLRTSADPIRPFQDSNFDLEGVIRKQSAGHLTVDQGQGILFRVVYDDKTPIVKDDGSSGSEKDLKIGASVHVVGDLQASGEIKAQRIEIQPKQAAPSTEKSSV